MVSDCEVRLHRIWRETNNRLDVLRARVDENLEVMAALDFARWLLWSGILELLEANACDGPLKVDGSNLRWKCGELQSACQERFRLNDTQPHMQEQQLRTIHEKLDLMAGYLSKLAVPAEPGAAVAASRPGPDFEVISGGLDVGPSVDGQLRGRREVKSA